MAYNIFTATKNSETKNEAANEKDLLGGSDLREVEKNMRDVLVEG